MSLNNTMKSIMKTVKETTFDYGAVLTLQKHKVIIDYNPFISENCGYILTPSTIYASPEDKADFQRAIDFMVLSLTINKEYILLFQRVLFRGE